MTATYTPGTPCRLADVPHWDAETDVLVVGFGIAGACAAIEAASAGASVTVLEVASTWGGSAALSGGEFYLGGGGGTPVQQAAGFEDSTEDFASYLRLSGGPGVDEERVGLYAEGALDHFRWLQEQGIPFKGTFLPGKWLEPMTDDTLIWSGSEMAWPFSAVAKPAPRGHAAQMEGMGAGKVIMDLLAERALGLGVRAEFDARALSLVADTDNAVQGLVARIDGQPRFIRARKGVILCAGGFICNQEMLRRFAPEALVAAEVPTTGGNDDGSGIRMGMSVGGAVSHMHEFFATKPLFPPDNMVRGIFVNQRGQRFINEDAYHGRICRYILRQPEGRAWLLMDNAIFARPDFRPDIDIAAVGESWEEVETDLGLPAGELVHTVERYNAYAEAGEDPLFHKHTQWMQPLVEPPFAALSFCPEDYPATGFTLGGLTTQPTGEVLDVDGQPVPGLYAAGRTTCGLPRWGEGYSSGISLGDGSFFGRLAGRTVAARPAADSDSDQAA
ncbi:MAG: flavoprotein [Haliea sp.]|nr:flavoprotein [Haliea sp.]|tara:strand:+ start:51846 stop:53351 length:1506 start_codon:yes stop_codon:yes gene_type:complete